MNAGANDLPLLLPAFVAGLLVLATHVPLGAQVLQRGIVFIDLAIAQIAALGVIVAGVGGEGDARSLGVQLAAAAAAVLGALLLTWTEKRWPRVQEAQIGTLFILAATGGILLLAHNPHGGEHLRDLLAGQILWVSYPQLLIPAIGAVAILGLLGLRGRLGRVGFYLVFALAVTASVQLVGVYLVFASLIIPSLATRNYAAGRRLPFAYAIGAAGYAAGLLLSSVFDLPSGALIVWCLALIGIGIYALGPADDKRGERRSSRSGG
jgi:zinc/manganese transport system permease protein